jgi:hypothetical protein
VLVKKKVNNEKYQTHIGCLEKGECCMARWRRKEVNATSFSVCDSCAMWYKW